MIQVKARLPEQKAVAILLSLLHLGIKGIRLGPKPPAWITPGVFKALQEGFDLKLIGDPAADLEAMLLGKRWVRGGLPARVAPPCLPNAGRQSSLPPVKIGLIIRRFQESGGGTEVYLHGLAAHLLSRGAEVHVLASACQSPLPVRFRPVPVPPGPSVLRTLAFARGVGRALAAGPGLDVVCGVERLPGQHLHLATGGSHHDYLAARRRAAGPLWALHSRLRPLNHLILHLERAMYRDPNLKRVRVMSRRGADDLARLYGLPEERLAVIPHGVDLARFELGRRPECRRWLRERHGLAHGLADDEPVAVLVGTNFELKGLAHLLRALGLVRQGGGVVPRLLVIGRGSEGRHRRLAARLGLAERVVFVGTSDRVPDYLLGADLFVLPSLYETFGLAVLEAMAAQLPVLVSAACGAAELVEEGLSGLVLDDPADTRTFAGHLSALADPALRTRLGKAARATAARFGLERDYAATLALIEETAAELTR